MSRIKKNTGIKKYVVPISVGLVVILIPFIFLNLKNPQKAKADATVSFNEGYGSTVGDANATVSGTVTNAVWKNSELCKEDKCLYFDGTGDFINFGDDADLDFSDTASFTISLWFRHAPISSGTQVLIAKTNGTAGYKIQMESDGDITFGVDDDSTWTPDDYFTSAAATYDDNNWHHIEAVKNGQVGIYLYIDGVLIGSDTTIDATATLANTANFYIGIDGDGSSNGWVGFIDEVKIYTTSARTAEEVKADFVGTTPTKGTTAEFAPDTSYLSSGLVAYWPMDESPNNPVDFSGNGNTGTVSGSTAATGKFGNSAYFDGANDVIDAGSGSSLDDPTDWTISTWIYPTSTYAYPARIAVKDDASTAGYGLYLNNGTSISAYQACSGTDSSAEASTAVALNTWLQVTATYSDAEKKVRLYFNGVEQPYTSQIIGDNSSTTSADASYNFWIGNSSGLGQAPIGYIDDLRVYNRALSPAEIRRLYSWAPGPVGYWKLDEKTGSTAYDSSGNGANLTNYNSTPYTSGKFGSAGSFASASNNYFLGSDTASLSQTKDLTLQAWIKPASNTAATQYDIAGKWDGLNLSYLLAQYGDEIRFYVDSASNYVTTNSANLIIGNWYHVSASYNAAAQTVTIYVNGVVQATTTTGTIPTYIGDDTGGFFIGSDKITGTYTDGYGGDINTAYDTTLRSSAATANYGAATGLALGTTDHILMKFNLSAIPSTSTVLSATYSLFRATSGGTNSITGTVYSVASANSTWPEGTKTPGTGVAGDSCWSYKEQTVGSETAWAGSAGASTSGTDYESSSIGTWNFNTGDAVGTEYQISLNTTRVAGWLGASNTNYGIIVIANNTAGQMASSDHATTGYRPKLVVTYTNTANYFNGVIDDVKMYNYARSQAQLVEDLNGGHPTPGSPIGSSAVWWKFDDMTGTSAQDSGPNNIDGTLSGSNWTLSGKNGGAWDGGDNRRVSVSDAASQGYIDPQSGQSFSISTWFKSDGPTTAATEYLVTKQSGTSPGYDLLFTTSGYVTCEMDDDMTSYPEDSATTATDVYDQTWHHIVCVRDNILGKVLVYVDGLLAASDTSLSATGSLDNAQTLYLGDANGTNGTDEFLGDVDDFKFYTSALSAEQIKIEYTSGLGSKIGSITTSSTGTPSWAAADEYCVPGDSTTCNPPVAYYKFDDNSGTNAVDSSGNNYTATMSSMPTSPFRAGIAGTALRFDGSNDLLSSGTAPSVSDQSAYTIEAWVKPDYSASNYYQIVSKSANSTPSSGWIFGMDMANHSLEFLAGCSGANQVQRKANNVILDDIWQHVAVIWDHTCTATGISLYVNGKEVTYTTTTNGTGSPDSDAAQNLIIGGNNDLGGDYTGLIDNVRIYNYARNSKQINWEINRGAPIIHYKVDECTGTTLFNSSTNGQGNPNGNNATISIGGTGTYTSTGTCGSGTGTHAWNAGTTGKFNGSLGFDGTNDVATTTANSYLDQNGEMSAFMWIKPNSTTGVQTLLDNTADSTTNDYGLNLNVQSGRVSVYWGGTEITRSQTTLATGTWYHVGFVRTGSAGNWTSKIYINGALDNTSTTAVNPDATNAGLQIGGLDLLGGSQYYNGLIDDIRVYNYPLTIAQIQNVFNGGAALKF